MSGSKVMYVGSFSFSKNGRTGFGYNFVEFNVNNEGLKQGHSKTLFTTEKVEMEGVQPGDVVTCGFQNSVTLGGKPVLFKIETSERLNIF